MTNLNVRKWHGYCGAFIAPSMIFFALTGALQLFNLHEAHGRYQPAPVIEKLGRLHKDQVFAQDETRGPPPIEPQRIAKTPALPGHDEDDRVPLSTLLLKWFFMLEALGLVLSTLFGLLIGLSRPRRRSATLGLVLAGTVIPLLLLMT